MATVWPGGFTAIGLPAPKGNFAKVGPLPAPSNYLATAIIFAPLALLSDTKAAGRSASLFGWGLVLASLLSVIDPTNPVKPCASPTPQPKPSTAGPTPRS